MNTLELRRVVDLLNRELYGLLKLNLRFRRQVASDKSLHEFLDSFLQFRSRWRYRECLRNRLVPAPRTHVSAKAISLPRRPVITSAIPELVGGKLIGLVNLLVPAAFTLDHSSSECDQCASRIIRFYCSSCECSIDWGAYTPY
ncbi:unnamed protein product [Malus baccata var. baccata]